MKAVIIFVLFLLILGCTKKEFIIEGPKTNNNNHVPQAFSLSFSNITNSSAIVVWDKAYDSYRDSLTYEFSINDSVIAYNLKNYIYYLKNLTPNTNYKISVTAVDMFRNSTTITGEFRTMKSFFQGIISLVVGFESLIANTAIETADTGLLIACTAKKELGIEVSKPFIVKLDKDYKVEWIYTFLLNVTILDLIETNDRGYLVTTSSAVFKINNLGKKVWSYEGTVNGLSFKSAVQDISGNYILCGGQYNYSICKLSPSGQLIWKKFGVSTRPIKPYEIMVETNGNLLLFGTVKYKEKTWDSEEKVCFTLLKFDDNGTIIHEDVYPNKFEASDDPVELVVPNDQNYLLFGTSIGVINGYYSRMPRFLKVRNDGSIFWDQYHHLNSVGFSPYFVDADVINNGNYLILTHDDMGIAISTMNNNGTINLHIRLPDFPYCIFIRSASDGNYHCITRGGDILIFNHDGYR